MTAHRVAFQARLQLLRLREKAATISVAGPGPVAFAEFRVRRSLKVCTAKLKMGSNGTKRWDGAWAGNDSFTNGYLTKHEA